MGNGCKHGFSWTYAVNVTEDPALCAVFLTIISVILIVVSLPFSLFFCVKVRTFFLLVSAKNEKMKERKKKKKNNRNVKHVDGSVCRRKDCMLTNKQLFVLRLSKSTKGPSSSDWVV